MRIDVYFDLICPWCYIGKRRFEDTLAARPDLAAAVDWIPFQLHPATAGGDAAGGPLRSARAEVARPVAAVVAELARREGLDLASDRRLSTPPTLDAHRLVRWLAARGVAPGRAVDALFATRFRDGRDIGDRAVLAAVAAALDVDRRLAATFLAGIEGVADVRASDASARRLGVHAVPCFVFDGRYAVSGAQEPRTFQALLDLARADTMVSAG